MKSQYNEQQILIERNRNERRTRMAARSLEPANRFSHAYIFTGRCIEEIRHLHECNDNTIPAQNEAADCLLNLSSTRWRNAN